MQRSISSACANVFVEALFDICKDIAERVCAEGVHIMSK